jgi:hypothetical protein
MAGGRRFRTKKGAKDLAMAVKRLKQASDAAAANPKPVLPSSPAAAPVPAAGAQVNAPVGAGPPQAEPVYPVVYASDF